MYPLILLESILNTVSYKKTKHMSPKQCHVAIIYKRGKILSIGINKIGTRSRGCGWNDLSIHAEIMAIKNIGDMSKLRGAKLLIVRYNTMDEIQYSKPCDHCRCILEKCMKQYGLRTVYYS
jgi:hypothetical protein